MYLLKYLGHKMKDHVEAQRTRQREYKSNIKLQSHTGVKQGTTTRFIRLGIQTSDGLV